MRGWRRWCDGRSCCGGRGGPGVRGFSGAPLEPLLAAQFLSGSRLRRRFEPPAAGRLLLGGVGGKKGPFFAFREYGLLGFGDFLR